MDSRNGHYGENEGEKIGKQMIFSAIFFILEYFKYSGADTEYCGLCENQVDFMVK